MTTYVSLPGISPVSMIYTIRKECNKSWSDGFTRSRCHGSSNDPEKAVAKGTVFEAPYWSDHLSMHPVLCAEHDALELVPSISYEVDLHIWYGFKLHPRFSIFEALVTDCNQRIGEVRRFLRNMLRERVPTSADVTDVTEFRKIVVSSHTKNEFIKKMQKLLMVNLYIQGRRIRVTNGFKEKFKARSFNVDDFFNTPNQEIRRHILRVIPIEKVIARLTKVSQDKEGVLYKEGTDEFARRYLHVKCPSTAQEYLLEVPRSIMVTQNPPKDQPWRTTREEFLDTPAKARRWTFNVPNDAEFVKEA